MARVRSRAPAPAGAGTGSGPALQRVPWALLLAVFAAALVPYARTLDVPFLFDDHTAIVDNPSLRLEGGWLDAFRPPQDDGTTTSGRPLVNASFALNHAWSGLSVTSYHVVNSLLHACVAVLLFLLVRAVARAPRLGDRWSGDAGWIAFAVALPWAVHPLHTSAVTYIAQRAEVMVSLFLVATLLAVLYAEHDRRWRWIGWTVAVAACFAGMASKEVMVAAPVLAFLLVRAAVETTWIGVWRGRAPLWVGLASSWVLLGWLVADTGGRVGTAGFDTAVSPWMYLLTQAGAIVRYIGLVFWPSGLVFDHGTAVVAGLGAVLPQAVVVTSLALAAAFGWRRPSVAVWAGTAFFGILAPSSSFIPIATQTVAEHRMYLASASVIGLAVCALLAFRVRSRHVALGAALVALPLGWATWSRNELFRDDEALWLDTVAKVPRNARAHANLGVAFADRGRDAEALAKYRDALAIDPTLREAHFRLGNALARLGRVDEAIARFERVLELTPGHVEGRNRLGLLVQQAGDRARARRLFEEARDLAPERSRAYYHLANLDVLEDRLDEAEAGYRAALARQPGYAPAHFRLGELLARRGRLAEARPSLERAAELQPDNPLIFSVLGAVALSAEDWAAAERAFGRVLQITPNDRAAAAGVATARARQRP